MSQDIKTKVLKIRSRGEKVRKSFTLSRKTAEQWTSFSAQFPEKSGILELALTSFMEEYQNGNMEIELDFGGKNNE